MRRLEETEEYKLGRNGEIIMHSFAIEYGCTAFDIAGSANGRAPVFNTKSTNITAPDALHIRNVAALAEYKTKASFFNWKGGDGGGILPERIPPCLAQGINAHLLPHYQTANEKLPLTLWFLTLNAGALHVASLDELGEPWPSVNEEYPMVNWPLSRMFHVVSFEPKRLWQFVRNPRRHDGLPTASERKELLQWLRPRQLEFDAFIEHFLIWREARVAR